MKRNTRVRITDPNNAHYNLIGYIDMCVTVNKITVYMIRVKNNISACYKEDFKIVKPYKLPLP